MMMMMMMMMMIFIKKWSGKVKTRNMYQWRNLVEAIRKFLVPKMVNKLLEQAQLSDHFIFSRRALLHGRC
jgi:hypothetical protein